jgi:cell division protein FtsA
MRADVDIKPAGGSIVGLDMGTTKVCAVIGEISRGHLKIMGFGSAPSRGMRRGVVVDVEKTIRSIESAVEKAELMAGVKATAVYAGIAGDHIRSLNSHGAIATASSTGAIGRSDKDRVIATASTVSVPTDREIIHVLEQDFSVDGQMGIRDPVGMVGVRLEADVHLVTAAVTSTQNVCKCIQRAGYEVRGIVLEPLASAYAVLEDDERAMGVCVVDIGGGTTDVAIFGNGSVRQTAVIGLGGQNVTSDIAIGLRASWPQAEAIKCDHGRSLPDPESPESFVSLPGVAGRPNREIPGAQLTAIIQARMDEIFTMVKRRISDFGAVDSLAAGVVLTGGGVLLNGSTQLAERVLDLPVRIGIPRRLAGMGERVASPVYATVLGLVHHGMKSLESNQFQPVRRTAGFPEGRLEVLCSRLKSWFQQSI